MFLGGRQKKGGGLAASPKHCTKEESATQILCRFQVSLLKNLRGVRSLFIATAVPSIKNAETH